jgi:hypothetical protein
MQEPTIVLNMTISTFFTSGGFWGNFPPPPPNNAFLEVPDLGVNQHLRWYHGKNPKIQLNCF